MSARLLFTIAAVTWLLLLATIGYLIWSGSDRRDEIREATADVILQRCGSENTLRHQLSTLVLAGRDNLEQYHHRGLITDAEYRETLEDQDAALRKLRSNRCAAVRDQFLQSSD